MPRLPSCEMQIDPECIMRSRVCRLCCQLCPAAMRIHTGTLKSQLQAERRILDRQACAKRHQLFWLEKLERTVRRRNVHFEVDPKFHSDRYRYDCLTVSIYGNSHWKFSSIMNEHSRSLPAIIQFALKR